MVHLRRSCGGDRLTTSSRTSVVQKSYYRVTAEEKVTLTLDAAQLEELRRISGARSLSAALDRAVAAYLAKPPT